jgi:hypothetical protein
MFLNVEMLKIEYEDSITWAAMGGKAIGRRAWKLIK